MGVEDDDGRCEPRTDQECEQRYHRQLEVPVKLRI
jgi:hypothetical protein